MSLIGYVHKDGGTTSTTGGTNATLASFGGSRNQHEFYVAEDPVTAKRRVKTKTVDPKAFADLPGGYTPRRSTTKVLVPKTLADGTLWFNTVEVNTALHVETTAAEAQAIADFVAQYTNASQFQDVILIGVPG